jgi:hypothetical protein
MKDFPVLLLATMAFFCTCKTSTNKEVKKSDTIQHKTSDSPVNRRVYVSDSDEQLENEASIPPPPRDLPTRFTSIEQWFINVADSVVYNPAINVYDLGLFESQGEYVIFVHATTTHNVDLLGKYMSSSLLYYRLTVKEVDKLSRTEIMKNITEKLKKVASTPKYKKSALNKARAVVVNLGNNSIVNLNSESQSELH